MHWYYIVFIAFMTSDSEDDTSLSGMWSSYLRDQEGEETKSRETKAEEAYARSRSKAIMTAMSVIIYNQL